MRSPRSFTLLPGALAALVIQAGIAHAADTTIENEIDKVNKHFAEASKDFGDGVVQLHSRREGADGTTHTIYHFDCTNKKYDLLFSGLTEPEAFPIAPSGFVGQAFDQNHDVAPLAQHTCTEHGYPLAEW